MKARLSLAMVATMLLPGLCFSQAWQASSPSPVPAYRSTIPANNPGMQPMAPSGNYSQPMAPMMNPMPPMPPMASSMPTQPMANRMPMNNPMPPIPNAPYSMPVSDSFSDAGFSGGCASGDCGAGSYEGYGDFDSFSGGGDCCGDSSECGSSCRGTYFALFGGVADLDDQRSTGFQRNLSIQFDQGYGVGGAIGRRVGRSFRTELEYVFRSQNPGVVNFNGNFPGNVGGFQNSHAGMINFAYDLIIGNGNIVPYLGAGIGVAGIDSRVRYGNGSTLDGDDTSLAYQWMAGFAYRARPNLEMFVEYRFFEIDDPKLNRFGGPPIGVQTPNILLNSEYASSDIFAGFRFNF